MPATIMIHPEGVFKVTWGSGGKTQWLNVIYAGVAIDVSFHESHNVTKERINEAFAAMLRAEGYEVAKAEVAKAKWPNPLTVPKHDDVLTDAEDAALDVMEYEADGPDPIEEGDK